MKHFLVFPPSFTFDAERVLNVSDVFWDFPFDENRYGENAPKVTAYLKVTGEFGGMSVTGLRLEWPESATEYFDRESARRFFGRNLIGSIEDNEFEASGCCAMTREHERQEAGL